MKRIFRELGTAVIMLFALTICHAQISHTDCVNSVNTECAPCYNFQCTTVDDRTGVCITSCRSPIPFCDPAAIVISTEVICQYIPESCTDPAKPYYCTLTANRFDMCKNVACGSFTASNFCSSSSTGAALTKAQRILAVLKARRVHA